MLSLPKSQCDRCNAPKEKSELMMSIFNTQMLCHICQLKERQHPKFEEARDAELDAISRGDFNFPGIGLPEELKGDIPE